MQTFSDPTIQPKLTEDACGVPIIQPPLAVDASELPNQDSSVDCQPDLVSWAAAEGAPYPLGVTIVDDGQACNFALYSRHAHSVRLLLFRESDVDAPAHQVEFDHLVNKSGRVWHCRLPMKALEGIRYYAYSLSGPSDEFHAFDPEKILLDPYARSVYFPKSFDREAAVEAGSNAGRAPLGVLNGKSAFSWGDDRRPRHESTLVIYEMHVKGFTAHPNSGVGANKRLRAALGRPA